MVEDKRPLAAIAMALLIVLSSVVLTGAETGPAEYSASDTDGGSGFPGPAELASLFLTWMKRFERPYDSDHPIHTHEKLHRFAIFVDNFRHVFAHNRRRSDDHGYWLGLNAFSDLSHDEFTAAYLWKPASSRLQLPGRRRRQHGPADQDRDRNQDQEIPESVDWREHGAVTAVKNQGRCGSCWAFSTVAAVEGINQIATGSLVPLSEQQLIDCSVEGNNGCDGGSMPAAFDFLVHNQGLDTEQHYPYEAKEGECRALAADSASASRLVRIDGYTEVEAGDEEALLRAVAKQPVSVGIEASHRDFQFYAGGVYDGNCGIELDHGVAIVGYGTDATSGDGYWIVKNSWGPEWGDDGFILMKRTGKAQPQGKCGINMMASFPTKINNNANIFDNNNNNNNNNNNKKHTEL